MRAQKKSPECQRPPQLALWVIAGLLLLALGPGLSGSEPLGKLPEGEDYGAGITLGEISDFGDVLSRPEKYAGSPVLIRGRIADVCQRKGCWTVLSRGEDQVRVRFKDYGFFLPKDCSGKQAYVEGVVAVETLSEKMARHYADESRTEDPSEISGPRQVVGFTASGVRIVDEGDR
jgi:hypothetical protein